MATGLNVSQETFQLVRFALVGFFLAGIYSAIYWYLATFVMPPVLAVVILFSTIFTFGDFNIVQVLTRGGPMNTTHLFATLAYQVGLSGGNLGQGAAISLFIFPLLALVVFCQLRYVRRD